MTYVYLIKYKVNYTYETKYKVFYTSWIVNINGTVF